LRALSRPVFMTCCRLSLVKNNFPEFHEDLFKTLLYSLMERKESDVLYMCDTIPTVIKTVITDSQAIEDAVKTLSSEYADYVVDDPLLGIAVARLLVSLKTSNLLSAPVVTQLGESFAEQDSKNGQAIRDFCLILISHFLPILLL